MGQKTHPTGFRIGVYEDWRSRWYANKQEFRELLTHTPVIVSNRGREHHAYGHYIGGTIARDIYPDRIVIYQDALERDFGHDPELLRAQVERTVRHELAHHLGWDEPGVRGLGL